MTEIPDWLDRLVETVADDISDWVTGGQWCHRVHAALDVLPSDFDFDALRIRLWVRRLRETVLPLEESWTEEVRDQTVAAVEGVMEAVETGDTQRIRAAALDAAAVLEAGVSAALSGSKSATSAVWALHAAGAVRAAGAVDAAVAAAKSAEWAVDAAAEAWRKEADRITEELERARPMTDQKTIVSIRTARVADHAATRWAQRVDPGSPDPAAAIRELMDNRPESVSEKNHSVYARWRIPRIPGVPGVVTLKFSTGDPWRVETVTAGRKQLTPAAATKQKRAARERISWQHWIEWCAESHVSPVPTPKTVQAWAAHLDRQCGHWAQRAGITIRRAFCDMTGQTYEQALDLIPKTEIRSRTGAKVLI